MVAKNEGATHVSHGLARERLPRINAEQANACARGDDLGITLYGIKNCDTMKKARAWLDGHAVRYEFHDYKTSGIDTATLTRWAGKVGWETLLNRAGTTFRKLPETHKTDLTERKALSLMVEQPSMIKRPVLEMGARILVGFKPDEYEKSVRI
jgi:arsenate reductase